MIIAKSIKIAPLTLMISLLLACKKDPPPVSGPTNYYLPPEVTQYFPAQAGDTLVYRDSISGEYDYFICIRGGVSKTNVTHNGSLMFTEESLLHSFTSTHIQHRKLWSYTSNWALYQDGRQEVFVYEGSDPLMRFPVRLGDSLHAGQGLIGYSIISAFYPSFTVDNKTFVDVYKLHRYAATARLHSEYCDYYLAKGKGIVAVREYKTNRLWVLQ